MSKAIRAILVLAGLNGLLAVALGAFAAHGLSDPGRKELIRTGALYAMVHAAAALAVMERTRPAALLFGLGGLVFSASLYALAFGAPRWVGAVTPLGGVVMIGGWIVILVTAAQSLVGNRSQPS